MVKKRKVQPKPRNRVKSSSIQRSSNNSKTFKKIPKTKLPKPVSQKEVKMKPWNAFESMFKSLFKFEKHPKSKNFNTNKSSFVSYVGNYVKIPTALKNVGQNCYLNSALQGISACDKFFQDITDLGKQFINEPESLLIFRTLISNMYAGQAKSMEISQNSIFKKWNKTGQQDSYELLATIMNQVYNEIRIHTEKTSIDDWLGVPLPMRIIIKYLIICGCGDVVNLPLQSDLALHITIPLTNNENKNLQSLVDKYFDNDPIIDYSCQNEKCDGKNSIRYTRLKKPLPHTICVHLQKVFWNGSKLIKIKHRISFKKELEIKFQFLSESLEKPLGFETEKRLEKDSTEVNERAKCDHLQVSKSGEANIGSTEIISEDCETCFKLNYIDENENTYSKIVDPSIDTHADDKNVDVCNTFEKADCGLKLEKAEENKLSTETENNIEEYSSNVNEKSKLIQSVVVKDVSKDSKTSIENIGHAHPNKKIEDGDNSNRLKSTDEIRNEHLNHNFIQEKTLENGISNSDRISCTPEDGIFKQEIAGDLDEKNDDLILSFPELHGISNNLPDRVDDDGIKHYTMFNTVQLADREELVLTDVTSFGCINNLNESFSLVSVIVHSGSINAGHYICYKCIDNRWYLTDDSRIREVTEKDVFGCEAYILFYEKL